MHPHLLGDLLPLNKNYLGMPTKIRLQRHGKKGQPFYHIVIADGRAPRDGKFIEKIGTYNPLTKPASINLRFDKAIDWLQKGAQPTDTVRAILSYKGVLYKNHLLKGVKKGALTEEQAEAKFAEWMTQKEASIQQKVNQAELEKKSRKKLALEQEMKVNEAIAAKVAEKRAAKFEAEDVSDEEAAPADAEAPTEEAPAEEVKAEAPAEEVKAEAPAEEAKAEAPAEEAKAEAPAEEEKAEAPAEEAKDEPKAESDAPAEEASEEKPKE